MQGLGGSGSRRGLPRGDSGGGDDSWVLAGRHRGLKSWLVFAENSGVILGVSTEDITED